MEKKELSQIDVYIDTVQIIKIDHAKLKNDIFNSLATDKRRSQNKRDYAYHDFKISFSQPFQWLRDYIEDHFHAQYQKTLIPHDHWGNIYSQHELSPTRHQVDPVALKDSPDYTCIYGIEVAKDSCELVIEYDDNRRKNQTWHIPLEENKFIIFPSTQRYFISKNKSKPINVFLTLTYTYK